MGKYQSGQMGQTVNLLAYAFGGSNPSLPTKNCGSSSVDRALAFQAEGRGFESRLPLIKKSLSFDRLFSYPFLAYFRKGGFTTCAFSFLPRLSR